MTALLNDPAGLIDSAEIAACLVFFAWWFSPRQRRKRLREDARDRALLRRVFAEPTEPMVPTEGADEDAPVSSVSRQEPRPGDRS